MTMSSPPKFTRRHLSPEWPIGPIHASPALLRTFGFLGFLGGGLGTTYVLGSWSGVTLERWEHPPYDLRMVGAIVAGTLAGFIGSAVGRSLATHIKVRSPATNHAMAVLWHFGVMSSPVWLLVVSLALNAMFGRDRARAFVIEHGLAKQTWLLLGFASASGLATGITLLMVPGWLSGCSNHEQPPDVGERALMVAGHNYALASLLVSTES